MVIALALPKHADGLKFPASKMVGVWVNRTDRTSKPIHIVLKSQVHLRH
jgi:hypothetical protein